MKSGKNKKVYTRTAVHDILVYMEMIADFLRSRKGRDLLLACAMCLLALISFGLGRLSVQGKQQVPVALVMPPLPATSSNQYAHNVSPSKAMPQNALPPQSGAYVASKSGSVYHLPWCSGAKRIKEENKVWFMSKEEAERAGYRPASNCKGI